MIDPRALLLPVLIAAGSACAQDASLRLGGHEVQLPPEVQVKLAMLAREMFSRCGPNTLQHPGNFGLGALGVSEAVVGLGQPNLFVGPNFSRHGATRVEHLQCEYLPALELACLPALAPLLPESYRETCARLERDPQGRIVMPPPDIAPSCS